MLKPSKSLWHFPFISMESESTESHQENIRLVVLLSAIRIYAYMSPDEERRHFNECHQWKDGTSMSCHVLKQMLHKYERRLLDLIVRAELVVITLMMREGMELCFYASFLGLKFPGSG